LGISDPKPSNEMAAKTTTLGENRLRYRTGYTEQQLELGSRTAK
jgi:hypothetical protein